MFPSRTQWCIVTNNSCFRGRDHYCADCYYHPAGDKSGLELASQAIPRHRDRDEGNGHRTFHGRLSNAAWKCATVWISKYEMFSLEVWFSESGS